MGWLWSVGAYRAGKAMECWGVSRWEGYGNAVAGQTNCHNFVHHRILQLGEGTVMQGCI